MLANGRSRRSQMITSSDANKTHSPNPPFGHVAYLVACHYRKIIAKEKLPYDGRCASFCHLCRHSFEKTLAIFRRVLNIDQPKTHTSQKSFHLIGRGEIAD